MVKTYKEDKSTVKTGKTNPVENQAILVAGGSGFIGKNLVKRLSKNGETVVSMYHHSLPEPMQNVFPVCSDLSSVELLGAPLRGVNTVVYLAWENSFVGPNQPWDVDFSVQNYPNNVRMLNNLLRAMEQAKTRRIVFLSANGAKKSAKNPFLKEKYHAELVVLNSSIPEKVILRPTIVCGDKGSHDRFIQSILALMRFPWFYPVPAAKQKINPLHVNDVVDILEKLLKLNMKDPCAILETIGKESYQVEELFRLVAQSYNGKPRIQIRGVIGDWLVRCFFEKNRSQRQEREPKVTDFLALSNQIDQEIEKRNPSQDWLVDFPSSFSKSILPKKSGT